MTVAGQELRLPSGIVTFLLTDIEGSTSLFRSLGDAYADLLADHHRLIRAAIAGHGGTEIKTEGDAVLIAFTRVVDALAAARDAQLGLAGHGWPAGAQVRVRMGVHVGDARVIDGDYVSFALHQCTRVVAAGHGGQVLLSAAAARLADGALPPSTSLVDLGLHELRDFESPERLYQLRHPGLPEAFPPLRAPAHRAGEDADQLLRLAEEAFMAGDLRTVIAHLSAAVPLLAAGGRPRDAAMVCARLVIVFEVLYNKIAARAWYTRAVRLVEREPPCLEQGYVAVAPTGCTVDDPVELLACADLALDRARRFGDATLEVKALADGGLARVQAGAVAEGMLMLDEALALMSGTGAADPLFAVGRAVCSFFTACYYTADLVRFGAWSGPLREQGLVGSSNPSQLFLHGHCTSVEGKLLWLVGRWGEAETVLTRAYADTEAVMPGVSWHTPIALAELRILQGRLAEAETLLLGREYLMESLLPTARLYLARGDLDLACATARRGMRLLREDRVRAASLLGVLVEAHLGRGDLEEAHAASAELDARTDGLGVPALEAYAALLRARVRVAEGRVGEAEAALRDGLARLEAADLPRLSALLHIGLARLQEAAGERTEATLEARAAAGLLARIDMAIEADDAEMLVRLGGRASARGTRPGTRFAELHRRGERWSVRWGGEPVRLRESRGLRYLVQLLAQPGTPRHVFDLLDEVGGPWGSRPARESLPGATAMEDPTGRARRRRRVSELRDQLEDALAERDHDRALALKEHLDTEIAGLVAVLGAGMTVDQLRRRVTRAIRDAIARIEEAVPEAGAYLERQVRTGTLCVYEADPEDDIVWRVRLFA